jgi:hypothetical protein
LSSAASDLGFGAATFSKDTLYLGDTLFISTHLVNYDSVAYNDTISFSLKINGVINVNPNIFPNPFLIQPINIPSHDSIPANFLVVITPAYFQVGPDILVVWPIASDGSPTRDTLIKSIFVLDPSAVGISNEKIEQFRVFCFDNSGIIQSSDPEIHLNRVRIFNISGQAVSDLALSHNNKIPFSDCPDGMYFAEVTFNSTQKRIVKFIKI